MRFKGTIFLVTLLTLLGFYLYTVEFPEGEKKQEAILKTGKLFSFEMHEISRLTITSPQGEFELEYFPGHPMNPWRIFHPVETVANDAVADELAHYLVNLKSSRLVEVKPTELKDFGLDPPQYRVLITINQTDTEIVEVGTENLTGSDVYLRKGEGTSLYLIPIRIKKLLDRDLNGWRRREIFPVSSQDILKIEMTSHRGTLRLSKKIEGWAMESSPSKKEDGRTFNTRGNRGEIANLLGSIVNLRGDDFIDFKKEEWQETFGPPLLKIKLKVDQVDFKATFYKGELNPDILYVVSAPLDPIFQIAASDIKSIDQDFEFYRDQHLVLLEFPGQIETLKISREKERYSLSKRSGVWWLKDENGETALTSENRISGLLANLYNLELSIFQDNLDENSKIVGLKNPHLTIHLEGKEGKPLGEMAFGALKGERMYGKSSGQPHPFLLPKSFLNLIPLRKDFLLKEDAKIESPQPQGAVK